MGNHGSVFGYNRVLSASGALWIAISVLALARTCASSSSKPQLRFSEKVHFFDESENKAAKSKDDSKKAAEAAQFKSRGTAKTSHRSSMRKQRRTAHESPGHEVATSCRHEVQLRNLIAALQLMYSVIDLNERERYDDIEEGIIVVFRPPAVPPTGKNRVESARSSKRTSTTRRASTQSRRSTLWSRTDATTHDAIYEQLRAIYDLMVQIQPIMDSHKSACWFIFVVGCFADDSLNAIRRADPEHLATDRFQRLEEGLKTAATLHAKTFWNPYCRFLIPSPDRTQFQGIAGDEDLGRLLHAMLNEAVPDPANQLTLKLDKIPPWDLLDNRVKLFPAFKLENSFNFLDLVDLNKYPETVDEVPKQAKRVE